MTSVPSDARLEILPVAPDRWADLAELFERPGPRGGTPMPANCWCMWWRQRTGDAALNKAAMQSRVGSDADPPGLIAYAGQLPVGWVSVAPRTSYGQLMQSRLYRPLDDDDDVYVIACYYIDPRFKRHGIGRALLAAAVDHAIARGAAAVEAYPSDRPDFMGLERWYADAGFEPWRQAGKRTVVRLDVRPAR